MLVRCVRILDPFGDDVDTYPGLRVGQCYPVLEILASPEAYYLRILDDDGDDPGTLWDPEMFKTVDGHLPACWSSALTTPGTLHLAPAGWLTPGFWGDYFDGDPAAQARYAQGKTAVLADLTT